MSSVGDMHMAFDKLAPSWYALHTKSRFENLVFSGLEKKNISAFLPKIKVKSKRRDRRIILDVPLFPGYVFVNTDLHPEHHLDVLKTVGAVRLIGNADGPIPVDDKVIDSLKIMVSVGDPVDTGSRLRKGDRVLVVSGPFTGVEGIFWQYRGKGRVVVNIDALGQSAGVQIDAADVTPSV